jgi:hypothetical protein
MTEKRTRKVNKLLILKESDYLERAGDWSSDFTQVKDVIKHIKEAGMTGDFVILRELARVSAKEEKQLKLEVS